MNALFEITQLAAKDTFELELNNANGEPIFAAEGQRISVTVYGPGSKQHQCRTGPLQPAHHGPHGQARQSWLSAEEQRIEQAEYRAPAPRASTTGLQRQRRPGAIVAAYADPTIGFIADRCLQP